MKNELRNMQPRQNLLRLSISNKEVVFSNDKVNLTYHYNLMVLAYLLQIF